MKKRLLSIVLTVCVAFGALPLLAGCELISSLFGGAEVPSAALEYALWLRDRMPSSYQITGRFNRIEDEALANEYEYTMDQLGNIENLVYATVNKSGSTVVSTIRQDVTDYNSSPAKKIGGVKSEFIKSADGYRMVGYSDKNRTFHSKTLSEGEYIEETAKMLLPETLLSFCFQPDIELDLTKNRPTGEFLENEDISPDDENNYSTLVCRYIANDFGELQEDRMYFDVSFIAYKDELHAVYYAFSGRLNGSWFHYLGNMKVERNTAGEAFDKRQYYSSEEECIAAVIDGVFANAPATYRIHNKEVITSGRTTATNESFVAYEKTGDTVYFYQKQSDSDDWAIYESYTQNGNGHTGRRYNNEGMTYIERTCEQNLCGNVNVSDGGHLFINSANASLSALENALSSAKGAEIEFDDDGVCTVTFSFEKSAGKEMEFVLIIDGKVIKKVISTVSLEDDSTGLAATTVMTSSYTYNTEAINADLSGYTKA